jgi:hypothetical protein
MPAPFFFSYAHNDALDEHVDAFFSEVSKQVRYLTAAKEDGFRDTKDLRAGDLWSDRLADELRVSPAIVCLYSPSYFDSRICAREMQIFLERRAAYLQQNTGSRPSPIIPVLWQPGDTPWSLPDFQYERPRSADLEKKGVYDVLAEQRKAEFVSIARSVAVRVKEARKGPLPELNYRPVLNGVQSAFDPPPLPPAEFDTADAASGPQCATFVYPAARAWKEWMFAPAFKPLLHISAAVARGRDLHSHQLTFDPAAANLAARLAVARERNNLLILLLDEATLGDAALAARLREFDDLDEDEPRSALVVASRGSRGALAPLLANRFPKLSLRQAPFLQADLGDEEEFARAIADCIDALRMAVVRTTRTVTRLPGATQYQALPGVTGPGGRKAA